MTWQTKIDTYSRFPYCCKSFQEGIDHTSGAYFGDDGEPQTAFFCACYSAHRAVEQECLAEECPFCELVGIDEYNQILGGAIE